VTNEHFHNVAESPGDPSLRLKNASAQDDVNCGGSRREFELKQMPACNPRNYPEKGGFYRVASETRRFRVFGPGWNLKIPLELFRPVQRENVARGENFC